ncbi:tetratricopeptide repeat protein [uncultured Paludibaculum sp.]|uniref:tetratricopeptide repeat protein n=1 Tax=uncultured Paludibaculum sp. TaxID=1765020 RepID=UPI002AABC8BB|nr:tetratricopeptide repeat protein [uncultured Paludibaculum sp.]
MKNSKRTPENRPSAAPAVKSAQTTGLPWWAPVGAAILALIAYFPALNGPFLFDDLNLPMLSQDGGSNYTAYLRRGVRALTNISLLADKDMWAANTTPYHLENFLLHVANALLVYFILKSLMERAGRAGQGVTVSAGFGAAVFLLHPLHTEAVAYIASRSEVLSVFFSLSALLVFLRRAEAAVSWARAIAVMALLGLGTLSKETAVAMVGVLVLTDWYFSSGFSLAGVARNWRLYVPLLAGGAAVGSFVYRLASREGTVGSALPFTPLDYLFTQFQVVWVYVRLFALPYGQNLDHGFAIVKAPGDALSWLGLVAIVAAVSAAFWWRKQYPLASLGLLTFFVLLTPTSSILPIEDPLVERRVYFASLGLLLIVCEFVSRWTLNTGRRAALGAVAAALALLTMFRSDLYASTQAMWVESVKANPQNYRAQFQLAFSYYEKGECSKSVEYFQAASRLRKPDYRLLVDWALALDCANDVPNAIARLQEATKVENKSNAWSTMGMIYGKRNQPELALDALNHALQLNRGDVMAYVYRGNVYFTTGQPARALEDFEQALRLDGTNPAAQQGRTAAMNALGRK